MVLSKCASTDCDCLLIPLTICAILPSHNPGNSQDDKQPSLLKKRIIKHTKKLLIIILCGLENFHPYCSTHEVSIVTNHKPLVSYLKICGINCMNTYTINIKSAGSLKLVRIILGGTFEN